MDQRKQKAALGLKKQEGQSVREICAIVGIVRNTYYKYIQVEDQPRPQRQHAPKPAVKLSVA